MVLCCGKSSSAGTEGSSGGNGGSLTGNGRRVSTSGGPGGAASGSGNDVCNGNSAVGKGTSGTSKELVFQTDDGSLAERFRVTLSGAKVTGNSVVTE